MNRRAKKSLALVVVFVVLSFAGDILFRRAMNDTGGKEVIEFVRSNEQIAGRYGNNLRIDILRRRTVEHSDHLYSDYTLLVRGNLSQGNVVVRRTETDTGAVVVTVSSFSQ